VADRRRRLRFTRRPWRYYLGVALGWAGAESAAFTLPHLHHRLAGALAIPACVLLGTALGYAWESAAFRKETHDG
jgi:hypothetical protein